MKNKIVAAVLAWFLGYLGIHCFYLGQNTKGIIYLAVSGVGILFCWLILPAFLLCITGLLAFIDFILILVMSDEEFNRKFNPQIN